MSRFRNMMYRFFNGRYGADSFEYFLFFLYAVLCILSAIWRSVGCRILTWAVFGYIVYRMMSRNYAARRRENVRYLKIRSAVKIELKLLCDRLRHIKSARYRRCHHCHAIVKLPVKRGRHSVKCPKCSKSFNVRIL